MDLDLTNQTAVVVGGANGIGLAIARAFAAEGARVAVLDRDERALAGLADPPGRRIERFRADITGGEAVKAAAAEMAARIGRPEHIVHAAAVGSGKYGFPFLNLEPSDWERVLKVNVMGAVNVAHAFAPDLIAARSGTFTFIASVAGQIGSQTDPPYSASKAALLNFVQCMARDLAPHGVRVNAICPGMVKTALNRSVWESWNALQPAPGKRSYEEWAGEKVKRVVPLGRWQEPEDIAAMAVFLASKRAANITGQAVNVDGGYVMK